MTQQFKRSAAITVGPAGQNGVRIDAPFRIVFEVNKDVSNLSNTGRVSIYGLSRDTRNQIERWDRPICIIEAGYDGAVEVLAAFEVYRTIITKEGPEIVTTLELIDGARLTTEKKINVAFAGGTPVSEVVDRVIRELGLPVRATGVPILGEYLKGISLSGPVSEVLNKVVNKAGLSWSIQNNEVQILDRFDESQGRGVLLTPESGLLDLPAKLFDTDQIEQRRRGIGYGLRALLNPQIRPGERLTVESQIVSTVLRVDKVSHRGDTRGPEWQTYAEAYGV